MKPVTFFAARAVAVALLLMPSASLAGDPEAGEREWRQCRSCHMIVSDAGETIQRGGRVGPNLYGIIDQQAGVIDGFRYSASLVEAGQGGLVWNEENFIGYVEDPTGFLRSFTGDGSIRSPMNFQLRSGAADLYAYLLSLSD